MIGYIEEFGFRGYLSIWKKAMGGFRIILPESYNITLKDISALPTSVYIQAEKMTDANNPKITLTFDEPGYDPSTEELEIKVTKELTPTVTVNLDAPVTEVNLFGYDRIEVTTEIINAGQETVTLDVTGASECISIWENAVGGPEISIPKLYYINTVPTSFFVQADKPHGIVKPEIAFYIEGCKIGTEVTVTVKLDGEDPSADGPFTSDRFIYASTGPQASGSEYENPDITTTERLDLSEFTDFINESTLKSL